MNEISASAYADTKPHYEILDGLRGVAAIMVVFYHIFEAFNNGNTIDQIINHGYLAVDFFFLLSGFVIAYAYDDRWKTMKTKDFIKRRLIRLQPMVIMGALIGAAMFYTQGWDDWNVAAVSFGMLIVAMIMNMFLIPSSPNFEIRGYSEMFPLNGPSWSLFFEYIGNILYFLIIRRLSTKMLAIFVAAAAIGLSWFSMFGHQGDICFGWTLTGEGLLGGSLRLIFAFSAGMLLSRIFRPMHIKGSFRISTLFIIVLLAIPRIGLNPIHLGHDITFWTNGVYDAICVILVFPFIVYIGASGKLHDKYSVRICKFLGDISYPLYMIHYPFIYLYYAWVKKNDLSFVQSLPGAVALVTGSIVLAYLLLKLYDEPVRKYLTSKLLPKELIKNKSNKFRKYKQLLFFSK